MTDQLPMIRCKVCKHVGPGRIPKGGDGSALLPYPHKRWQTGFNPYVPSGGMVWCEGRYEEGEWVSDD